MPRKKPGSKKASSNKAPQLRRSEPMNSCNTTSPELSPERLEAIRRWVEAGGHNDPAVAERVARRIIDRGDLRGDPRDDRSVPRTGFDHWIH
jgi:hypothetical protein